MSPATMPELGNQLAELRATYAAMAYDLERLRRQREDLAAAPIGAVVTLAAVRALLDTAPIDPAGRVAELDSAIINAESRLSELHEAALSAGILLTQSP